VLRVPPPTPCYRLLASETTETSHSRHPPFRATRLSTTHTGHVPNGSYSCTNTVVWIQGLQHFELQANGKGLHRFTQPDPFSHSTTGKVSHKEIPPSTVAVTFIRHAAQAVSTNELTLHQCQSLEPALGHWLGSISVATNPIRCNSNNPLTQAQTPPVNKYLFQLGSKATRPPEIACCCMTAAVTCELAMPTQALAPAAMLTTVRNGPGGEWLPVAIQVPPVVAAALQLAVSDHCQEELVPLWARAGARSCPKWHRCNLLLPHLLAAQTMPVPQPYHFTDPDP
jgi:hypothetical protein